MGPETWRTSSRPKPRSPPITTPTGRPMPGETRVISQAVVPTSDGPTGSPRAPGRAPAFAAAAAPAGFAAEDVNLGAQSRAQFAGVRTKPSPMLHLPPRKARWSDRSVRTSAGTSSRSRTFAAPRVGPWPRLAARCRAAGRQQAQGSAGRPGDPGQGPDPRRRQLRRGGRAGQTCRSPPRRPSTAPAHREQMPITASPQNSSRRLQAGFAMEAGADAEVVTLPNEAGYALVAVDQLIEAAPAPLARSPITSAPTGSSARPTTGRARSRRKSRTRSRAARQSNRRCPRRG